MTKVKGVMKDDGTWIVLDESQYAAIEAASKSDTLAVQDVQPIWDLPMQYATGTYYVRYAPPKKGSTAGLDAFAAFARGLGENGAVVMWKRAAAQDLCVIHTDGDGLLLLTKIPTVTEHREPGTSEQRHLDVDLPDEAVKMMGDLLDSMSQGEDNFKWGDYADEAYRLRSEAVEKILGGQQLQKRDEKKPDGNALDLMEQLRMSMAEQKDEKVTLTDKSEKPKTKAHTR